MRFIVWINLENQYSNTLSLALFRLMEILLYFGFQLISIFHITDKLKVYSRIVRVVNYKFSI